MPALPPGRNDPSGQQESGSRAIRVFNFDDEDAPPFAALEIIGWDSDRRAFRVRRCSVTGRNDLIFGGLNPIPSRMEGQAWGDAQHVAGFLVSEGANPHPGEVWGVKAGEWLLTPNYPGYVVLDTTTASRGFCVVQKQRSNITEFIRVTGTVNPDLELPDDWVEAELVFHDPVSDEWGTTSPTTPVYFRDIYNRKGYYAVKNGTQGPCYVHVTRTGLREGRPVYVGKENCSTTTTTLAPCLGACEWDWNTTTKRWVLDANSCNPSASCKCLAPTFCPPDDGEAYCTQTRCGRLTSHQSGPNCTGTTTTAAPTCTTTNAPSCTKTCEFFSHPVLGWVQTENNCPVSCPCPFPSGGGGGACETATTACQVIPVTCSGGCRFTWVTPPDGDPYWHGFGSGCVSSGFPPNCYCDGPTEDGNECGSVVETPCYIHDVSGGGSGGGGCQCCDNTTTTAAPGTCGRCLWGTDDGEEWENRRNCPGCMCLEPDTDPTAECDLRETPCYTTTTTTTGGPTTTTTTTTGGPTTTLPPTTVPPTTTTAAPCKCCGSGGIEPIQASITGPIGASCGVVTNHIENLYLFGNDIWQKEYTYPGGPTGLLQVRCGASGFTAIGFIDYYLGGFTSVYYVTLTPCGMNLCGTGTVMGGPCNGQTVSLSIQHPCPGGTYCPTTTTTTTTTGGPTTTSGPTTTGSPYYPCYDCTWQCNGTTWVKIQDCTALGTQGPQCTACQNPHIASGGLYDKCDFSKLGDYGATLCQGWLCGYCSFVSNDGSTWTSNGNTCSGSCVCLGEPNPGPSVIGQQGYIACLAPASSTTTTSGPTTTGGPCTGGACQITCTGGAWTATGGSCFTPCRCNGTLIGSACMTPGSVINGTCSN